MTDDLRSPLALPMFRAVWLASLVSYFGVAVQIVGASWLMTDLTSSPQMVAAIQTANAAPIFALSLWAGAMADNLERRKVIAAAQFIVLGAAITLAFLAWSGRLSPWPLVILTAIIGCGTALNNPSWQASVGDIVPRDLLPRAVGLNSMGFNVARSLGPALGGGVVALVGAAGAFMFNGLSTLGLIAVMWNWKGVSRPTALPRERLGTAMASGVRYVSMSPTILTIIVRATLFATVGGAIPTLLPLVARSISSGGAIVFGALLGAFGAGAVTGALATAPLRALLSSEGLAKLAATLLATGTLGVGLAPSVVTTIPLLVIGGFGWVTGFSNFNIGVQLASPRWVVGRSLALFQTGVFGGLAGGSWLIGAACSEYGIGIALSTAAIGLFGVAAIGLVWRLPETASMELDPQNHWKAPDLAVPVKDRTGPVVISIEHRISDEHLIPFLNAMSERRRIRRRDGARHWTLLRDLGEVDLWIERYSLPTWLEYVRHIERRTVADETVDARIRALWHPEYVPVVHRRIERQVSGWPAYARSSVQPI